MTNLSRQLCQIFTQENEPNSSKFFPEFSAINCKLVLDFCASKLLYDRLEIRANYLNPKKCNKCWTTALGNVPKLPKNNTAPPRNLCQNNSRTNRTKSIQYGLYFLPFSCYTEFKNPYSTTFFARLYLASIYVHALLVVRPAQSVQYGLPSMLSLLPQFLC
jgi:hypothetical protein